jgi:hypothetical protein
VIARSKPFASIVRGSSKLTASPASCLVDEPARISPGAAACWRRAPRLTSAPITIVRSSAVPDRDLAGAHTDPDLERHAQPELIAEVACRSRMSSAARMARSASSSRADGMPNTTSTASPMKRSATPPYHAASSATMPWNAAKISRKRSGSTCEASSVEPVMSTKTTDTRRRSEAAGTETGAPQLGQKFAPGGSGRPHRRHGSAAMRVLDDLHRIPVGIAERREPRVPSTSPTYASNTAPRCSRTHRVSSRSSTFSTTVPLAGGSSSVPCSAIRTGPPSSSAHSSPSRRSSSRPTTSV